MSFIPFRRRLRLSLVGAVLAGAACSTGACQVFSDDSAPPPAPRTTLRIAHTWGEEGRFAPVLRDAIRQEMPDVEVTLIDSSAGVTNLSLLRRGEVDAASTYADIAYMAFVGQLPELAGTFQDVRAIAALPIRELQVVVAPKSPFQSIRDLRGRRVSLGPAGTGVAITAALLLSAYDIGAEDLAAEHLPFDEAVQPVMDGTLDAAFWGGRLPNPNIEKALGHGARLLQIEGPEIDRFRAEYPFLRAAVIPAGTYTGLDEPVHTVGVDGTFVCRADMDERLVYKLTQAFFRAVVQAGHHVRMLRGFNMSRAAATPLPLHPGAARYYRETEMRR